MWKGSGISDGKIGKRIWQNWENSMIENVNKPTEFVSKMVMIGDIEGVVSYIDDISIWGRKWKAT